MDAVLADQTREDHANRSRVLIGEVVRALNPGAGSTSRAVSASCVHRLCWPEISQRLPLACSIRLDLNAGQDAVAAVLEANHRAVVEAEEVPRASCPGTARSQAAGRTGASRGTRSCSSAAEAESGQRNKREVWLGQLHHGIVFSGLREAGGGAECEHHPGGGCQCDEPAR